MWNTYDAFGKKSNLLLSLITVIVVIRFISLVIISCPVAVVVFL